MTLAVASRAATLFEPVYHCWVCDGSVFQPYHECRFDFHEYATPDPDLDAYTGQIAWLARCTRCGFGQPDRMPTLPRFFDRMYDQRCRMRGFSGNSTRAAKTASFGRFFDSLPAA